MTTKSIDLSWVVVKDLTKAVKFYTEVLGLELKEMNETFGWAELQATGGGSRLGIAQNNDFSPVGPGSNAVVTFTVEDIERAKSEMEKKGVEMVDEIMEIPTVVKLQLFVDTDGNKGQLVELLG